MERKCATLIVAPFALIGLLLASCGSSSSSTSATPAAPTAAATAAPAPTAPAALSATMATDTSSAPASTQAVPSTTSGPGALTVSEAQAAASGDVPDNQVFLVYRSPDGAFSMKYPEGWAQSADGGSVVFRDHNNLVRVAVSPGTLPTAAAVGKEMATLKSADASVTASAPTAIALAGKPAIRVAYTTQSAPNAVTGKRVTLGVDRYYIAQAGKLAVIDLGTPKGVDNVDAYRLMVASFRWM